MRSAVLLLATLSLCPPVASSARDAVVRVDLEGRDIRLSDLVAPDVLARTHLANRTIARVPANAASVELSDAQRRALIHRQFPLDAPPLRDRGWVVFRAAAKMRTAAATCRKLRVALGAGAVVSAEDTAETPCDAGRALAPLSYDEAARIVRAEGPLEAGAYLGAVAIPANPGVARGTVLKLVSRAGPVELTREVTLLQGARDGREAFVKSGDGEVFPVRVTTGEAPR